MKRTPTGPPTTAILASLTLSAFSLMLTSPDAARGDSDLIFAGDDFRTLMSLQAGDTKTAAPRAVVDLNPKQPARPEPSSGKHHDNLTVVRDTALSPNGQWIAVQADMGTVPMTWLLQADDRKGSSARTLVPEGYGFFLGWHPNSEQVLYKVIDLDVTDPGLWLVDAVDGSHQRIDIPELLAPEGLLTAAISADGKALAYAFSNGIGTGSEIWLTDLNGSFRRQLHREPQGVVASLQWSNQGRDLAFNTLFDSPVPFAEAGLWVYDLDEGKTRWLAQMDGGHGEQPLWSDDDSKLYFVARDNPMDTKANRDPAALVSSIRSVDAKTGAEALLLESAGARQIDLTRGADGKLLFVSNRAGGSLEVWTVDDDARAEQLTADGTPKRHPLSVGR